MPEPGVALPSLLDDPPGRAIISSYVPRPSLGLDDEAVDFYGVDGRWRRLDIGDLALPANDWSGGDTYGAGALSPDGRWWAGPMIDGMFLVNLSTGSATVLRKVRGRSGMASFAWSPDSDELVLTLIGRASRVSVPDLKVERFPRPDAYPGILADGGWVECPNLRRVTSQCNTYGPDGSLTKEVLIPVDLQQKWAGPVSGPVDVVSGSLFYSLLGGPYGNYRNDVEVLRTDSDLLADARLILPKGSEVNGTAPLLSANVLGLAATGNRLLLAWLVNEQEVVKVLRPGVGLPGGTGQDFWDISYAPELVQIH